MQKFLIHSYELMRHYKYITLFSTIVLLSPLSFNPQHRIWRIRINGGSSWRIWGKHTAAHHIMSCEAPGPLSEECSMQCDLQCRSPWESTTPLNCYAVHVHHMNLHFRHTWLTDQINNLYLKSEIPAWKTSHIASQQTR